MPNKITIRYTYLEAYLNELTTKGNYLQRKSGIKEKLCLQTGIQNQTTTNVLSKKMVDAV